MQQITIEELDEKVSAGAELFLLDVREEHEHKRFNIGGILIPLDQIMRKAGEIPTDKPVVVYCRKGVRSQIAIRRLEGRFGFTNLYNLAGGIEK
jgi:rhodanese-related sulfurtransferase